MKGLKYHILKEEGGQLYLSGLEWDNLKAANHQAEALRDELGDEVAIHVLDDLELAALRVRLGP